VSFCDVEDEFEEPKEESEVKVPMLEEIVLKFGVGNKRRRI